VDAQRIPLELMRAPAPPEPSRSRATVHRIIVRHGLVIGRRRRRKRSEYVRWQRPTAMQLWQIDFVGGVPGRSSAFIRRCGASCSTSAPVHLAARGTGRPG
jgi:hypothetical protein